MRAMADYIKKTSLFLIFIEGILFFFTFGKNPIREYDRKRRSKSDLENISRDWNMVGNDIRIAYEKFKSGTQS